MFIGRRYNLKCVHFVIEVISNPRSSPFRENFKYVAEELAHVFKSGLKTK